MRKCERRTRERDGDGGSDGNGEGRKYAEYGNVGVYIILV